MRRAITLVVILIAAGIVAAAFFGQGRKPPTTQQPPVVAPEPPTSDSPDSSDSPEAPSTPDIPHTSETSATQAVPQTPQASDDAPAPSGDVGPVGAAARAPVEITPIEGLHVAASQAPQISELGGLDPKQDRLKLQLSSYGAAVRYIHLPHYHDDLEKSTPYVLQSPVEGDRRADGVRESRYPFAALGVWINDRYVDLQSVAWHKLGEGRYSIDVLDGEDAPVLTIERHYSLRPNSYTVLCEQKFVAHGQRRLRVVWEQYGQGDVTADEAAYMGDRRDIVTGYFDPEYDAQRRHVFIRDEGYLGRTKLIDKYVGSKGQVTTVPVWPNDRVAGGAELVWLASVNRYFAAVIHRPLGEQQPVVEAQLQSLFPTMDVAMLGHKSAQEDTRGLIVQMRSAPLDLAAGQTRRLDLAIFAGPRLSKVFADEAQPYHRLGFDGLVRYNLGGPCSFCTFQWLAKGLLAFMRGIHFLTRDWGIAIIVLVLVVRAILHPITKRAQVNMMRMGKQMQSLQPEIEKLKKKYKDDSQGMQKEMMQLYREKGINPANALGCLPMFLQTPIWIALYAMLYYAIELRHVPAFYDVFNRIAGLFGGEWHFLSDLSTADHFIKIFDAPRQINLWFIHPNFQAINLLPILMGVTFFFQQKLMAPPPANEQAAQTQKMMKWMTLLFPFMLYSAPSGLTLYILASTGAGIVDSLLVKKHVKKLEEEGTLLTAKKPGKSGIMARIAEAVAEKQKQIEAQKRAGGNAPRYKDRKR